MPTLPWVGLKSLERDMMCAQCQVDGIHNFHRGQATTISVSDCLEERGWEGGAEKLVPVPQTNIIRGNVEGRYNPPLLKRDRDELEKMGRKESLAKVLGHGLVPLGLLEVQEGCKLGWNLGHQDQGNIGSSPWTPTSVPRVEGSLVLGGTIPLRNVKVAAKANLPVTRNPPCGFLLRSILIFERHHVTIVLVRGADATDPSRLLSHSHDLVETHVGLVIPPGPAQDIPWAKGMGSCRGH
jgi:hypothetical protein